MQADLGAASGLDGTFEREQLDGKMLGAYRSFHGRGRGSRGDDTQRRAEN
jgi:hypothetical protein